MQSDACSLWQEHLVVSGIMISFTRERTKRCTLFFNNFIFFPPVALRPNAGHGLLILEVSRSHTATHHIGRTPLNEWSARRRDLYLTTNNTHNRQTAKPPVGFEPTILAGERPQTYALDRAAAGTGFLNNLFHLNCPRFFFFVFCWPCILL